jgi:hypothetical protein
MFNTLYRCPRTIARHENGPLSESRSLYQEHLAAQGVPSPRCLLSAVRQLRSVLLAPAVPPQVVRSGVCPPCFDR